MKKMIFILVTAMLCTMTMNAQSALELAKEQRKLNEINAKMLNLKPTKDAKKQARQLKKAGWLVPAGEKSIEMIPQKELLPLTGYIHGGCSPIGMKKQFDTFIDETAILFDRICFSGGRVGFQVRVRLDDLKSVVDVKEFDLVKS